jgi:hypothetical protein
MTQKRSGGSARASRRLEASAPTGQSPAVVHDHTDPGDATQRNFRYQHSYGVVLIVAAKRGTEPYVTMWCEHHEDFLAERADGVFDAYQIKTSTPENGAWMITHEPIARSIGRFVDLVDRFGARIGKLVVVSNTAFATVGPTSHDDERRRKCPEVFVEHIRDCPSVDAIAAPFISTFDELRAECGCSPIVLFGVLQRMHFVRGPGRHDFDAVLAHEHLGTLDSCKGLSPEALDRIRDELVALVFRASSLQITGPNRYLPLSGPAGSNEILRAKQIRIAELTLEGGTESARVFTFPGPATLPLGKSHKDSVLRQKLERGGLDPDNVDGLLEVGRAAERHLIELAVRSPDDFPALQRQLEAMVLRECRDVYLRVNQLGAPFGHTMLLELRDRLRHLATDRPHMVGRQEYECLEGVAALLTESCRVWWSDRFQVDEDAA